MSVFTSSGGQQNVNIQGSANPLIANIDIPTAGTEYSYTLPLGTKQFLIRSRNGSKIQLSYNAGESSTLYITVPKWCFYSESELLLTTSTDIFFQSNQNSEIVELLFWI